MRGLAWRAIALGLLLATPPAADVMAVQIGGPFALVDQQGMARTDADYRGSYLLIYFGYTYCPDLCPTTLVKMGDAIDELAVGSPAKADRVVPMFISVDPERDTPEVLRSYAQAFHPRMVALTGSPRALANVGRRYGVLFAKSLTGDAGSYMVDHTSFVYLMGPDGKYIQHFESDVTVEDLVDALQRQVAVTSPDGS